MAADPSIYNALMAPRKSAFDYANELEDQAYQREQRGTQRQMNALQLQQAQQSQADDQAYREAARGFGADTDANANMLLQRGLAKQAMQYRKDALEGTKTKSEIQLNASKSQEQQASAAEKQFKLEQDRRQKHLQELVGVNDVQSAHAWLDQAAASGELPPDKVAQVKAQLQANPNMLQQWKQGAIAGGFTLQQQRENEWKQREFDLKQDQFGEQQRHNKSTEGIAAGTLGEARRHHGAMEGAAGAQLGQGKIPPGYRQTADGNLQAIPGGPADQKQIGALNADTQALTGSISGFDRLAAAANELLQHPGLAGITGLRGALPNIPGGEAANAQALLGTLKSQIGFGVLQDMRNNSKTGGALGNVSDAEGKRLEANLAALDKSQSLKQYKANLQKIIDYADGAKDRVREAYNLKHGNRALQPSEEKETPAVAGTSPTIRTDAEYNALPSGTTFVGPDGKTRRKP